MCLVRAVYCLILQQPRAGHLVDNSLADFVGIGSRSCWGRR
jgi:hypothetical protein